MRALFLTLLLAGCMTVGPDYKRPETPLPAEYPAASSAQ